MEKAKLKWFTKVPPNMGEIECQFNPSELTISKSVSWSEYDAFGSHQLKKMNWNAPPLKFGGGSPATYSLALFFDAYSVDGGPKDVREYTNKLLRLTMRGAGYAMFIIPYADPPWVTFVWGKITLFTAVVESVSISYTMFAPDGTPIRAKATVAFKQNEILGDDIIPAQNPTSRTDARRTRIVHTGQRLDQIAYEEYGDARYWRLLAEANRMDDPFHLSDGQILVIPQSDLE
jgi:nucleoid-associated protein YgaU